MKPIMKVFIIAFVASIVMISCNQKAKDMEMQIAVLTEQNESLRNEAKEQENNINEFFESMAQIRDNLNEIKLKQNLITKETRDTDQIGLDVRKQIEEDLTLINELMEDNRRRMTNLNRQLRNSNLKIEEFENLIAGLTSEIEQRNQELYEMKENITQLSNTNENLVATVERLEEDYSVQQNLIEEKISQLNTAYYIYGTRRELRDQEIIDRQGGLLGLGRTTVITSNIDRNHFNQVDITQVETLEVPSNKVQLVSSHPSGSYTVETNGQNISQIVIDNPEKFWSNTRYLVVSID